MRREKSLSAPLVITIGLQTDPKLISMFPDMQDSNAILRVQGQHYGPNRV